jgi:uroporphyrin-III C-methyltransferase
MRNIPTHPGDDFTLPGQVTLVGAGPGDPELLTLKAVRAIEAATIVFVDDLVSDEVVGLASPTSRVVQVGKRGGCKSTPLSSLSVPRAHQSLSAVPAPSSQKTSVE